MGLALEMPGDQMKRLITRGMLCIVCVLSVFIKCDDDDDDDHYPDPNWAQSSLQQEEPHKEHEVRLSCEISPALHDDAFLRNPASEETEPDDFVAGVW